MWKTSAPSRAANWVDAGARPYLVFLTKKQKNILIMAAGEAAKGSAASPRAPIRY